jgi:hypothetical protein
MFIGSFVFNVFGLGRVRFTQIPPKGDELHSAIEKVDLKGVERLCQRGADVTFVDKDGLTPLAKAVQLCCGCCFSPAIWGSSPEGKRLYLERKINYYELIEYLLKNYSDKIDINKEFSNRCGDSILHYVAEKGDFFLVRLLCKYGVNVNSLNYFGRTPLEEAVSWKRIDVAIELLKHPEIRIRPEFIDELEKRSRQIRGSIKSGIGRITFKEIFSTIIQIICEYFIVDQYSCSYCGNIHEEIISDTDKDHRLRDCLDRFLDKLGYESYRKKCSFYKYIKYLCRQRFKESGVKLLKQHYQSSGRRRLPGIPTASSLVS